MYLVNADNDRQKKLIAKVPLVTIYAASYMTYKIIGQINNLGKGSA